MGAGISVGLEGGALRPSCGSRKMFTGFGIRVSRLVEEVQASERKQSF